ncbi:MAG: glucose-6-phosphate isomerase [Acidobacteriota bacterium]
MNRQLPALDVRFATDRYLPTTGLAAAEVETCELAANALTALKRRAETGEVGFTRLPFDLDIPKEILRFARGKRFQNFLLVGIGGSSLGAQALCAALRPWYHNWLGRQRAGCRFFVLDNVDADLVDSTLRLLNPRETLVNVVSKSGSTAETAANFMIVRRWLMKGLGRRFNQHIVATTDPHKGELLELAREEGYATFAIPPDVGGRFSVLTPVGLLPAHFFGASVTKLLAGARAMVELGMGPKVPENSPLLSSLVLYRYLERGRRTQVFMPYASNLQSFADWYRQLWAESLGKRTARDGRIVGAGQTLLGSIGTIDQHSQVQLLREGPDDKFVFFLDVRKSSREARIPKDLQKYPSSAYLGGHPLGELMRAERRATEIALASDGRPSMTLSIPRVDEFSMGALIMFFELQTAFTGEMLGVNAYDQPGVEEGKLNTFALMGRPGHEERRRALARYEG